MHVFYLPVVINSTISKEVGVIIAVSQFSTLVLAATPCTLINHIMSSCHSTSKASSLNSATTNEEEDLYSPMACFSPVLTIDISR